MSSVSVGRLGTLMRKVSSPAASFSTTTDVMSGASRFSPTASWNVALFGETLVAAWPPALPRAATSATPRTRARLVDGRGVILGNVLTAHDGRAQDSGE